MNRNDSVTISDEDINLLKYIKILLDKRYVIIGIAVLFLMGGFLYNKVAKEKYVSFTTFFLPIGSESGASVSKYGKLLKGGGSDLSDYVKSIVNSDRIKYEVAIEMEKDQPSANGISPEMVDHRLRKDRSTLDKTIHRLRLDKDISVSDTKEGLYVVTYENTDPEVAYKVLDWYVNKMLKLNQDLEISPKKNLVTVLDPPFVPKYPSKPEKLKNLFLALVGGVGFGMAFVLGQFKFLEIRQMLRSEKLTV